jgi:hypothetical protein
VQNLLISQTPLYKLINGHHSVFVGVDLLQADQMSAPLKLHFALQGGNFMCVEMDRIFTII